MTQELTFKRIAATDAIRPLAAKASWHRLALAAVLILSAFLNLFRLTNEEYGITYYAAAVKDMLTSWHNFFFVSFDAGFVSVDKPPLGLWLQAAMAWLFGFHRLSLLLPQALAGILCVALLYYLVRRVFGSVAGLIAALVLAVTPISVATSRNNTMDMLLVLTVLLAAWAFIYAAESGRLRWLLVGAIVVGLGFNIKMLEAYLVLPAFYLLYLLAAPSSWWRRFVHLGIATAVLLVVSLSWAVVVDLTPADQRPYVGSSPNNSELNLILGYNGLDRLSGISFGAEGGMPAGTLGGPGLGAEKNGAPGPFRLLNQHYARQIGWLLPLAVVGLLAASWQGRFQVPLNRTHQALVLWGTWFLTTAAYFSAAGGGHRYYTVILAPAVAALVGAGIVAFWSDYRGSEPEGWLLPMVLVAMTVLHIRMLSGYEDWDLRLAPVIVGLCLSAATILVVLRLRPKQKAGAYAATATAVGMVALLIAPTVWASYQVFEGPGGSMPTAGPPSSETFVGRFGGDNTQGSAGGDNAPGYGQVPFGASNLGTQAPGSPLRSTADPALMDYLLANQGDAEYLVAATSARVTAPIILSTTKPVISLGGFTGYDPVFTTNELSDLVNEGAVRFFLVPDRERIMQMVPGASSKQSALPGASRGNLAGPQVPPQSESTRWVQDDCERVPQGLWQSSTPSQEEGISMEEIVALYDCGPGGG